MPRRGNVPKREVLPDPNYNSVLVTKLVNSIMLDGKKGVAQKVVYGAFEIVENRRLQQHQYQAPLLQRQRHITSVRHKTSVKANVPQLPLR